MNRLKYLQKKNSNTNTNVISFEIESRGEHQDAREIPTNGISIYSTAAALQNLYGFVSSGNELNGQYNCVVEKLFNLARVNFASGMFNAFNQIIINTNFFLKKTVTDVDYYQYLIN